MAISTDQPAPPDEQPVVDVDAEFPTDWHRDTYIAGLEREIEGAKIRGDESTQKNAETELTRVRKTAEKRPRGSAAEKRG